MSFETEFRELFQNQNQIDTSKILEMLLDEQNIDMKTHIVDPFTFSILEATIKNIERLLSRPDLKKVKLPLFKGFWEDVLKQLKKLLVSWERLGRTEITDTLRSQREEGTGARSFFQKLIGSGK